MTSFFITISSLLVIFFAASLVWAARLAQQQQPRPRRVRVQTPAHRCSQRGLRR